jgi:hypothetical protein
LPVALRHLSAEQCDDRWLVRQRQRRQGVHRRGVRRLLFGERLLRQLNRPLRLRLPVALRYLLCPFQCLQRWKLRGQRQSLHWVGLRQLLFGARLLRGHNWPLRRRMPGQLWHVQRWEREHIDRRGMRLQEWQDVQGLVIWRLLLR